jgi:acetyl-CoA carboxylase carboxyltransferase component
MSTENFDANSELFERLQKTTDLHRTEQQSKRHAKGFRTARENVAMLCDQDTFREYGQLAVAAQRQRKDYNNLQSETAADGVITGVGEINCNLIEAGSTSVAIVVNDYSVLAGTQGYFHHAKLDRIIDIAQRQNLPVIMLTEGGGGRPSDTDITTVLSGLQCTTFSRWAGLAGKVPRITVNNGYCFAGNAALFGVGDITIATQASYIGMAGPAMIEGGGLGKFAATDIGPISAQAANGVVDIVAENEDNAVALAKFCLGFFQGPVKHWQSPPKSDLSSVLPADRRYTYAVMDIINGIVDLSSFIQIGAQYGTALVSGLARLNGRPIGVIANNCKVLGGAIDIDAANKLNRFLALCNQFAIPIVSLVDTPGFMVGPEHERQGAVRQLSQVFTTGAQLSVRFVAVVVRKCYGLGAQAMLAGSTRNPDYTISWPSGEFGAMGLEGAIKLGFKKELENIKDPVERQAMFDQLVAQQYQRGKAIEVASVLELDAVIHAKDTRETLLAALRF